MLLYRNSRYGDVLVCFGRKFLKLPQVANTLRNTNVLKRVEAQLQKIHTLTLEVAGKVNEIDGKVDTLVIGFGQILKNVKETTAKLDRQEMPSKPIIFFGRDELVKKISGLLSSPEKTSHICFLGPGGMGKTSLALAIVESPLVGVKFPQERCIWVPCVEATSGTLFLQVLYTSLRVKRQTDSTTSDILFELKSSTEPILLLLDNFETPWNTTDGQNQVDEVLRKLNRLTHVSILVTMRGSESPIFELQWHTEIVRATDMAACRRICEQINPNWDTDRDVDDLLVAVGCMPFAVTLMATRGRQSKSSARQLLDEWAKLGTDMLSPGGLLETGMNKSISLSVDSNFVKSDPDALYLLAILSLLPAGTTRDRLRRWAPDLKSESGAIATLSQAALLQNAAHTIDQPSETLFVLPVIQSFMLRHQRIPKDVQQHMQSVCCKYVLDHACRYWDPNFKVYSMALAREDTNIQSILVGAIEIAGNRDQLVQALLAFSWYRCDTKPLPAIAEHTLSLAKSNGSDRHIAEALLCLGYSYERLDRDPEAENLLEESSKLFRSLPDEPSAQKLGFECDLLRARVYGFVYGRSNDERNNIIKDVLARTEVLDRYWYARALRELGELHMWCGENEEALEIFNKATDTFLGLKCDQDAAGTLCVKAKNLNEMHSSDEVVLKAIQEAWEIARAFDPLALHGMIHCLCGQVLLRMGKLPDGLTSFEKALGAYQYVGAAMVIADALASIGYVYLHTGAYSDAYGAYEAATESYASLGKNSPDGQRCKMESRTNMENIRRKQENPDMHIGFYRPRLDRDHDELFYPPV